MILKKFGIEVRKFGTRDSLYNEVDAVLSESGIGKGEVNGEMQVGGVAHGLQRMFQIERYFDVCTIRSCANLCQVTISQERLNLYSSVHCMSWSEMLPDFRKRLIAMVLDDFREVLK